MIGPDPKSEKLTPIERTMYVKRLLERQHRIRTCDVARELGMTWDGAYKLLCRLSGDEETPLTQDDESFWVLLEILHT